MKPPVSTLKRLPAKLIQGFKVSQVGADTVRDYLRQGWSLAIFCKGCTRVTEWTPPELQERFSGKLDTRIAVIVPKLACTSAGGCGSHEVAVGPHLYDGVWRFDE